MQMRVSRAHLPQAALAQWLGPYNLSYPVLLTLAWAKRTWPSHVPEVAACRKPPLWAVDAASINQIARLGRFAPERRRNETMQEKRKVAAKNEPQVPEGDEVNGGNAPHCRGGWLLQREGHAKQEGQELRRRRWEGRQRCQRHCGRWGRRRARALTIWATTRITSSETCRVRLQNFDRKREKWLQKTRCVPDVALEEATLQKPAEKCEHQSASFWGGSVGHVCGGDARGNGASTEKKRLQEPVRRKTQKGD